MLHELLWPLIGFNISQLSLKGQFVDGTSRHALNVGWLQALRLDWTHT
jgi:hypothetical protein